MLHPIIVPDSAFPKKNPLHPCPCEDKEVFLEFKACILLWRKEVGDTVEAGQVVCEGEVEKKALEFKAPVGGVLVEQTMEDDDIVSAGDIIGFIDDGK